ncbi:LysE family transporter [Microbacterium immunditiarum]|uniref:Threonine/homoserine/homoserine lactone efflux protein n=1 Tax=Microbacterium immunditiarum TaxID=337480 RepID=A0A7Y9GL68_9MICO|nr:LysE family transporter [Microbacterium immunditiarum]NYE18477.1 threonine/homoserine/homoserine lactone efflux protein [Microbacterium immunditiarum]
MNPVTALASGALAGFAIAVPVGAIGVLLIQEGMRRGIRPGLAAAAGVASVDALYCLIAVVAGAAVAPLIARIEPWPAVVGGIALVGIAALGLRKGFSRPAPASGGPPVEGSALGGYPLFFGLTLINPATVVYFVAIATGLADLHDEPFAAALFVVGAGVASLAWQTVLVAAGALFGRRATPRVQHLTVVVGYVIVAGFGVALLVRALA